MSDAMSDYPFVIAQELLWRDMDSYQHVNNAVYFRYFEDVRMAMLESLGMIAFMNSDQIGPILASTRCDFRAPLTYPGRIRIGTRIEELKGKRMVMKYAVYSEQLECIAAEGKGLLVYFDYGKNQSCDIPPQFVPQLKALQLS